MWLSIVPITPKSINNTLMFLSWYHCWFTLFWCHSRYCLEFPGIARKWWPPFPSIDANWSMHSDLMFSRFPGDTPMLAAVESPFFFPDLKRLSGGLSRESCFPIWIRIAQAWICSFVYLPTVQGFPGLSRDLILCPGVQGIEQKSREFRDLRLTDVLGHLWVRHKILMLDGVLYYEILWWISQVLLLVWTRHGIHK